MGGAEDKANPYDSKAVCPCNIKVLIAGMVTEEISCTLPLTRRGDIEGYDSGEIVM